MYSNIQDCDEGQPDALVASPINRFCGTLLLNHQSTSRVSIVFNFFEPLHYLTFNNGFQTWELSPEHAIRSWTYILLHWPLAHLAPFALKIQKVRPP